MRFVFRADGDSKIGLGHITRCLALASELKKFGDVQFISKPLPIKLPFKVNTLPNDIDNKKDLELTRRILRKLAPNAVIVDHHDLDQKYLDSIKAFADLLVAIDDLKRQICADVVVNINAFSLRMNYNCRNGKVILGSRYALIKRIVPRKTIRQKADKILVSMGGADILNLTPKVIDVLHEIDGIRVTVVIGPAFANEKEIRSISARDNRFSVVHTNDLPNLMLGHDIAVCGGGTTLYELAATGTPSIILCQAENQFINARELHGRTLISLGMGDIASSGKIKRAVQYLLNNYSLRKQYSNNGKNLVDCKGPERVAEIMLAELKRKKIELKPAKKKDALNIWGWRNEKTTRMYSFDARFIPLQEHKRWFGGALLDRKKKIFVIINKGRKIGYVRIYLDRSPEINIAIGKKYRGLGFGSRAIAMSCALLKGKVLAKVKPENTASIKAFEYAGFKIVEKKRGVATLELVL